MVWNENPNPYQDLQDTAEAEGVTFGALAATGGDVEEARKLDEDLVEALVATRPLEPEKPVLSLIGQDGNAFVILGRAQKALRRAGRGEDVAAFMAEATAGDYDHVLQTCMKWFEVE